MCGKFTYGDAKYRIVSPYGVNYVEHVIERTAMSDWTRNLTGILSYRESYYEHELKDVYERQSASHHRD